MDHINVEIMILFTLVIVLAVIVLQMQRRLSNQEKYITKLYGYMDIVTIGAMYSKDDESEFALVHEVEITDDAFDICAYSTFVRRVNKDGSETYTCVRNDCTLPLFDFHRHYPNMLVETDENGDPTDVPVDIGSAFIGR